MQNLLGRHKFFWYQKLCSCPIFTEEQRGKLLFSIQQCFSLICKTVLLLHYVFLFVTFLEDGFFVGVFFFLLTHFSFLCFRVATHSHRLDEANCRTHEPVLTSRLSNRWGWGLELRICSSKSKVIHASNLIYGFTVCMCVCAWSRYVFLSNSWFILKWKYLKRRAKSMMGLRIQAHM